MLKTLHIPLAASLLLACTSLYAQPDTRDAPFSPFSIPMPELGRLRGTIHTARLAGWAEEFGKEVYAVDDVDDDGLADWIASSVRCDTAIPDGQVSRLPYELLPPMSSH
jgi:hypothetical protein